MTKTIICIECDEPLTVYKLEDGTMTVAPCKTCLKNKYDTGYEDGIIGEYDYAY